MNSPLSTTTVGKSIVAQMFAAALIRQMEFFPLSGRILLMRTLFAAAMNEATIQSNEPMRVSAPENFWCILAFVVWYDKKNRGSNMVKI